MATRRPAPASSPRANLRPVARREWAARRLGFGGQPPSQRPRVARTRFPDRCAACLTSGIRGGRRPHTIAGAAVGQASACAAGFSPQPSLREKLRARGGRSEGDGAYPDVREEPERSRSAAEAPENAQQSHAPLIAPPALATAYSAVFGSRPPERGEKQAGRGRRRRGPGGVHGCTRSGQSRREQSRAPLIAPPRAGSPGCGRVIAPPSPPPAPRQRSNTPPPPSGFRLRGSAPAPPAAPFLPPCRCPR